MAIDATFDNQLQALATATANFANGKDAAIKNAIITALGGSTQSGGSTSGTIVIDTLHYTDPDVTITDIEGGKRINCNKSGYFDVTIG